MLFYEWRSTKGGNEQRDQCDSPTSSSSENQQPSCSKNIQTMRHAKKEVKIKISHEATTSSAAAVREDKHAMSATDNNKKTPETESSNIINSNLSDAKVTESECDIESKSSTSTTTTTTAAEVAPTTSDSTDKLAIATSSTTPAAVVLVLEDCVVKKKATEQRSKRKSLLNKELEEWIWQDNRHYLEDRNIFEHTYFK